MYNKVIMIGRLVADPEIKTVQQDVKVCQFKIAVDRRFSGKGEDKKSDFFNVVAWRQQAEFVTKYFSKGKMIMVEGEMTTRQYDDKDGKKSTWYEIVADRISFTGEKRDDSSSAKGAPPVESAPVDNEDYPF